MYFIIQIKFFVILHTIVYVFTYEHYRLDPDVQKFYLDITSVGSFSPLVSVRKKLYIR